MCVVFLVIEFALFCMSLCGWCDFIFLFASAFFSHWQAFLADHERRPLLAGSVFLVLWKAAVDNEALYDINVCTLKLEADTAKEAANIDACAAQIEGIADDIAFAEAHLKAATLSLTSARRRRLTDS